MNTYGNRNDNLLKLVIFFIFAVIGGFSVAAALVPHCDDVDDYLYSKFHHVRILVVIIIGLMTIIGIVDLLGYSKRIKEAKTFATGLGLGMTIFQIFAIIMASDCFRDSWLLPIPSG